MQRWPGARTGRPAKRAYSRSAAFASRARSARALVTGERVLQMPPLVSCVRYVASTRPAAACNNDAASRTTRCITAAADGMSWIKPAASPAITGSTS